MIIVGLLIFIMLCLLFPGLMRLLALLLFFGFLYDAQEHILGVLYACADKLDAAEKLLERGVAGVSP
jgi:hypothetical protein